MARRAKGYWCQASGNEQGNIVPNKYAAHLSGVAPDTAFFRYGGNFRTVSTIPLRRPCIRPTRPAYSRFDQCYRLFNESMGQLQARSVDILSALATRIEELYVHWYLYRLGLAWDSLLAAEQRLQDWQFGVPKQSRFYETVIRARFMQAGVKRQFVIISDALRYEVAQELQGQINQAKRFSAQLSSQLSVLPSYTQLGMAALLPHEQITFADNGANVLVDGMSSAGLENPERHPGSCRRGRALGQIAIGLVPQRGGPSGRGGACHLHLS